MRANRVPHRALGLMVALLVAAIVTGCNLTSTPPPRPAVSSVSGYVSIGSAARPLTPQFAAGPAAEIVPGQVVVKLRHAPDLRSMSLEASLAVGAAYPATVLPGLTENSFVLSYTGADEAETWSLAEELGSRPDVVTAEVVPLATTFAYPNDPLLTQQWSLTQIGAEAAWLLAGAHMGAVPTHVIAVIDSGSRPHPDIDYLPGVNLVEGGTDTTDYSPSGVSHGTHVAGIAGARVNNGLGVAGVSPAAQIVPVKVIGNNGKGSTLDFARGILWAAGASVEGLPRNPNPAKVINISAGGEATCPWYLQEAVDTANARGATVVVAAGNDAANVADYHPANCAGVVVVGATGPTGTAATYTNYGTTVSIMAPGGDFTLASGSAGGVLSTVWDASEHRADYRAYQGTSMASPQVAGALALLRARYPTLTGQQAVDLLLRTAQPLAAIDCGGRPASYCGAGLLDLQAAVASGPPPNPDAGALIVVAAHCENQSCTRAVTELTRWLRYPSTTTGAQYAFTGLANGLYRMWAYIDVNGDGRWEEGEPWGDHRTLLDLNGRAASNINIAIAVGDTVNVAKGDAATSLGFRRAFQVP